MEIEFRNLSYTVRSYFNIVGKEKTILKNISGKLYPGQLCAILGASGAGKTTLLHVLSGYRKKGIKGQILTNGEIRDDEWFSRRSCYITQEDHLPPFMTVEEAMIMAAKFKLPIKNYRKQIDEILSYLNLDTARDTSTQNLSGGQKKRLSIALELIANPPVFFLDEPISGLDDVSAKLTINLLTRLAEEGRTVVCTIHQPSASIMRLFDMMYVMASGQCIYQGTPHALVPYLRCRGFECPKSYNPTDYIIEIVDSNLENIELLSRAIQNGKISEDQRRDIEDTGIIQIQQVNQEKINNNLSNFQWLKLTRGQTKEDKMQYPISGFRQFTILYNRFFYQLLKNKKSLCLELIHYLVCAFLLGICFYDNAENAAMMFNHLKFLVGIVLFYSYTRLLIPIIIYPYEVKLAKKEHFNRWYGMNAYYWASTVANLPIQIFLNTMFMGIVYYLTGFPMELWRFSMFALIGNLISMATEGLGLAIGALFHPTLGMIMGPSVCSIFLCLAIYGFDFAYEISVAMDFLQKLSPTRVGLSSLVIVGFGFDRKPMRCDDVFCFISNPKVLLHYVGGADSYIYQEMSILFSLLILYRIMAYISLWIRFRQS